MKLHLDATGAGVAAAVAAADTNWATVYVNV